jgi:copper resistance protein C
MSYHNERGRHRGAATRGNAAPRGGAQTSLFVIIPHMRFPQLPRRTSIVLLAMLALGAVPSASRGAPAGRHVHLLKSEPSANDTVPALATIRLWFSEKVELKVTTVRLVTVAGGAVTVGSPSRSDAELNAPVVSTVVKALAPGTYTVNWSTAANDGHPTKGTIEFVVKSAR